MTVWCRSSFAAMRRVAADGFSRVPASSPFGCNGAVAAEIDASPAKQPVDSSGPTATAEGSHSTDIATNGGANGTAEGEKGLILEDDV